jgi:hypothetical protein
VLEFMTFQSTSTSSAGATGPKQFVPRRLDAPSQMNSQGKSPFKCKRFFHALGRARREMSDHIEPPLLPIQ